MAPTAQTQRTNEEILQEVGHNLLNIFSSHDGLREFGDALKELNQRAVEYVYMGYPPAFVCKQALADYAKYIKGLKFKQVNLGYKAGRDSSGDPLTDILNQKFFEEVKQ